MEGYESAKEYTAQMRAKMAQVLTSKLGTNWRQVVYQDGASSPVLQLAGVGTTAAIIAVVVSLAGGLVRMILISRKEAQAKDSKKPAGKADLSAHQKPQTLVPPSQTSVAQANPAAEPVELLSKQQQIKSMIDEIEEILKDLKG